MVKFVWTRTCLYVCGVLVVVAICRQEQAESLRTGKEGECGSSALEEVTISMKVMGIAALVF